MGRSIVRLAPAGKGTCKEAFMDETFQRPMLRRNDKCLCGSGLKYKYCHGRPANSFRKKAGYIDSGEEPVRWVISDRVGTSFFSTKENKILVFQTRGDANTIATLEEFQNQEPGEINVAAVGATKWAHLQEKLPFVEVDSVEHAKQLVYERIEAARAHFGVADADPAPDQPDA
jgi:hypothetical protein